MMFNKIKTYEDALEVLNSKSPVFEETDTPGMISYIKLCRVVKALNDGWKPKKNSPVYIPQFSTQYSTDELNKLTDKEKKKIYKGFEYVDTIKFDNLDSFYTVWGKYLTKSCVLKSRELAEYCGKQFIKFWIDIYMD